VHCHDHGLSVFGDPWYGPRHLSPELFKIHRSLPGQALHAELLGFEHPITGERLRFDSVPPNPFQEALESLR
jgi:23S rRNA pseudouridine1911/1915/1917 synthase